MTFSGTGIQYFSWIYGSDWVFCFMRGALTSPPPNTQTNSVHKNRGDEPEKKIIVQSRLCKTHLCYFVLRLSLRPPEVKMVNVPSVIPIKLIIQRKLSWRQESWKISTLWNNHYCRPKLKKRISNVLSIALTPSNFGRQISAFSLDLRLHSWWRGH